jgi:hypothetical protein
VVVWFDRANLRKDVSCFGYKKGGIHGASQEAHCQGMSHIIPLNSTYATANYNLTYQPLSLKVMAHATVGFCFEGNPDNGGEGLLIGLNRCQAFKVAQKAYRGKGGVKVVKGDCLLKDCNVTGTDIGSPDKPKFALRALWEYGLLPSLDALVAPGGQCEGALVIHQEDNAGSVKFPSHALAISLSCNMFLTVIKNVTVALPFTPHLGPP